MENRANILQEVQEISQAVATIGNRNVYTVPTGYFDNLAEEVLAKVHIAPLQALPALFTVPEGYFNSLAGNIMDKIRAQEKAALSPAASEEEQAGLLLNTVSRIMPYSIPAGYFEGLADRIMAKVKAQASLEEIPEAGLLNNIGKQMPYTLPAGYFDNLAGNVMAKIKSQQISAQYSEVFEEMQQLSPLVNTISRQLPYSVPAGYFDTLAEDVTNRIKAQESTSKYLEVSEELEQLSPSLNSISRQMPYSVPEGYFQQLSVNIDAAAPQQAKVVAIKSARPKWIMYLAAACVTGILGIGGYLFTQRNVGPSPSLNVETALASLSDDDINNYLDSQPVASPDIAVPAAADDQAPDIQPTIEKMSTEEIQQYLKENSGPDEKSAKGI